MVEANGRASEMDGAEEVNACGTTDGSGTGRRITRGMAARDDSESSERSGCSGRADASGPEGDAIESS